MASLTLKNIPDDIYESLKRLAQSNRRSINSQIIVCIEQAVRSRAIDPDLILASARRIREKTGPYQISDEEFNQAKNAGRL